MKNKEGKEKEKERREKEKEEQEEEIKEEQATQLRYLGFETLFLTKLCTWN